MSVACVDINLENCMATVNKALQLSGNARRYICDVTKEKQVADTVEAIRIELGEVTMLFHCCGVPSPRALAENPVEIKRTLDISILSHFWVNRTNYWKKKVNYTKINDNINIKLLDAVLPGMQKTGKGHVIVLSSVAGLSRGTSRKTRIPLSAAQFAVQGFAESLQAELRHTNSDIIITLIHVYPFIVGAEAAKDIRFRWVNKNISYKSNVSI